MKSAINILVLICVFSSGLFSQGSTQNLKKQQKKIERKISNTKNLLKKVTSFSNMLTIINFLLPFITIPLIRSLVRKHEQKSKAASIKINKEEETKERKTRGKIYNNSNQVNKIYDLENQ